MSGEVWFSLPKPFVNKIVLFTAVGTVVGAAQAVNEDPSVKLGLTVGIAAAILTVLFVVHRALSRQKVLFLSAEGMGSQRSGGTLITWSDPVTITIDSDPDVPRLWITKSHDVRLGVPLLIARTPAFAEHVRRFAPQGHPLVAKLAGH